jgi:aminopeptidase-like protein
MTVCCEPQLGKRGLYPTISQKGTYADVKTLQNFIAYADGENDLFEISDKIDASVETLIPIVGRLLEEKLITIV